MPTTKRPGNTKYQHFNGGVSKSTPQNSAPKSKKGLWVSTVHRVLKLASSIPGKLQSFSLSSRFFFSGLGARKSIYDRSSKESAITNLKISKNDTDFNHQARVDETLKSKPCTESFNSNRSPIKNGVGLVSERSLRSFSTDSYDNTAFHFELNSPFVVNKNHGIQEAEVTSSQIAKLTQVLQERRKQVQQFIFSTQQYFLRYGPFSEAVSDDLSRLEDSTLQVPIELLNTLKGDSGAIACTYQGLVEITNSLKEDFAGLKRFIKDATIYDFRSGGNYLQQVEVYQNILPDLIAGLPAEKQESIEQSLNSLIEEKQLLAYREGNLVSSVPTTIDEMMELYEVFKQTFSAKVFNEKMIAELEKNSSGFEAKFHFYLDGQWKEVKSTYVPPAIMCLKDVSEQAGGSVTVDTSPFEHSYEGKLSPSLLRKTNHAMNMLDFSMEVDGQEITKQIRVGCPYAYTEKEAAEREKVTLDRTKEIFTALLMQNHATELQTAMNNPGHMPIHLNSVYFNLLSPDNLRSKKLPESLRKAKNIEDEKMWVVELHKMFKSLAGQPLDLKVRAKSGELKTIRVVPNVRMFVVPCNSLALKQPDDINPFKKALQSTLLYAADTWKTVNKINNESLAEILESDDVAEKMNGLSEGKQKEVNEILGKIESLKRPSGEIDFEEVTNNYNPFYFSELLMGLTQLIALDILSGCKSNKDRTSLFQTAMQAYLASGAHLHESQNSKDETLTLFHRMIFELFIFYGGHTELQKRNCGVAGFRIGKTPGRYLDSDNYQIARRAKGRQMRAPKPISYPPEMFTKITLPQTI